MIMTTVTGGTKLEIQNIFLHENINQKRKEMFSIPGKEKQKNKKQLYNWSRCCDSVSKATTWYTGSLRKAEDGPSAYSHQSPCRRTG